MTVTASNELLVTDLIPSEFQSWFPFETFTTIQSQVLPTIFATDNNILLCAPTGAGKTAIAEAAILRLLLAIAAGQVTPGTKAVYLAPMRALAYEKAQSWEGRSGISAVVFTGEEGPQTMADLNAVDLIISTPEKFDSVSRKWRKPNYEFVANIRLLIIDEVHLIDSATRGDALEALVARMQRIAQTQGHSLRIIAMSATIPNVQHVAEWLGVARDHTFVFSEADRPVPLHSKIVAVPHEWNWTAARQLKNGQLATLLTHHLEGSDAQALVFVNSRKETQKLAQFLLETWEGLHGQPARFAHFATSEALAFSQQVAADPLRDMLAAGVAFHHAGLSKADRMLVEEAFRDGALRVLCATTTLAWGVNFPARIVIVRDTTLFDGKAQEFALMSASDLKQIVGRAGRPGYDSVGYAYVITPEHEADGIDYLLRHGKPLSSTFLDSSVEHLLAEIVDGAITTRQEAVTWLTGTFHAVLLRQRCQTLPQELRKQVDVDIEGLATTGLIERSSEKSMEKVRATRWGEITSDYYLNVSTAEWFTQRLTALQTAHQDSSLAWLIETLAQATEFADLLLRRAEERYVWSIQELLPNFNRLPAAAQKVCYVLYCALMGELLPKALAAEAALIRDNSGRLLGALSDFSEAILGYGPWLLRRAQWALRYRKTIDQIILARNQDIPIEIEFSPIIEHLEVGQGQIVTVTVRNVRLQPLSMQIAVALNGLLLTQAAVDLKEVPWKFPFPLIGEEPGQLVYTVEVVPLGDENPLTEAVVESLEIAVVEE